MGILLSIFIWYTIGYVLSLFLIYLMNKIDTESGRSGMISLKEAIICSLFSWFTCFICVIVITGLDEKTAEILDKLDDKFRGLK